MATKKRKKKVATHVVWGDYGCELAYSEKEALEIAAMYDHPVIYSLEKKYEVKHELVEVK